MNQVKIGSFLKELRKEKGMTQEQLAEQFYVSSRTVSRCETGSNMPDLSLLVELADFYDVEMKEIINGERKSEKMNQEEKETLTMIADYAETEKNILLKKLRLISIIGALALIIALFMANLGSNINRPVFLYLEGTCYGIALGALLTAILYSTGALAWIRNHKKNNPLIKVILAVCLIFSIFTFIMSIVCSF